MYIGTIFWMLMILAFVLGVFIYWPTDGHTIFWGGAGMSLFQFVLFALLGWKVFGPAVKG